jgi:hypothetical protein
MSIWRTVQMKLLSGAPSEDPLHRFLLHLKLGMSKLSSHHGLCYCIWCFSCVPSLTNEHNPVTPARNLDLDPDHSSLFSSQTPLYPLVQAAHLTYLDNFRGLLMSWKFWICCIYTRASILWYICMCIYIYDIKRNSPNTWSQGYQKPLGNIAM